MWLTIYLLGVASTVAVAQPLAWELPYAAGAAKKEKKKGNKLCWGTWTRRVLDL